MAAGVGPDAVAARGALLVEAVAAPDVPHAVEAVVLLVAQSAPVWRKAALQSEVEPLALRGGIQAATVWVLQFAPDDLPRGVPGARVALPVHGHHDHGLSRLVFRQNDVRAVRVDEESQPV